MSINERVRQIAKAFGDSESGFAKRIEVSSSVMFNIVNPKGRLSYPSGPVLEKILSLELKGERVSAEWLMRGEGEMFNSEGSGFQNSDKALAFLKQTIDDLRNN